MILLYLMTNNLIAPNLYEQRIAGDLPGRRYDQNDDLGTSDEIQMVHNTQSESPKQVQLSHREESMQDSVCTKEDVTTGDQGQLNEDIR